MEQIGSEYNFKTGGAIKELNDVIARVDALEKAQAKLGKTSKETGDSVGATGTKVKKAKTEFDSLGNSINQVTREFPAFAFSAQTGFLAISNNIPILVDSINQLKVANAALAAEGKATIPVFKQVISSLISWQTALSLLISFSVMYGKEIGNFIGNLFSGRDAVNELKISVDALNEAYKSKELKSSIENLIELRRNIDLAQAGYVNKEDVLKQYNTEQGKVLGTTNDLNIAEQKIINATPTLINAYVNRAASLKLSNDAAQLAIDIKQKEQKVEQEGLGQMQFLLQAADKLRENGKISEKEYNKERAAIFDNASIEGQKKLGTNSAKELIILEQEYNKKLELANDFAKRSEKVLGGFGLIDDGSKERAAAALKAAKELAEKQKEILRKQVQDELNAAQEVYIKSVSIKGATNDDKERAELKLLEAQRDIFEKYKKYDEQYAQDSLDTREKLAEKILNIEEQKRIKYLKDLKEEYDADKKFMEKSIDDELDAIDEKYVLMKQGVILTNEEQLALDLAKTQEQISYLEKVKDAGEEYSDRLIKLKEKESDLLTKINNKNLADAKRSWKEQEKEIRAVMSLIGELGSTVSNGYFDLRKSQIKEETDIQIEELQKQKDAKTISEEDFNNKKKAILNEQAQKQRELDLAEIKVQTALSIIKTLAQIGFTPLGFFAASLAAAQGAIQYSFAAAQPLPRFAKGTDRVMGGTKGQDSVHALLMPDEAVIPAKENLARPNLAKAWINGNLDSHLMMNYIKPAIDENNKKWEAMLKVNQNSTFIRNDNFNDKRIVNKLDKLTRVMSSNKKEVNIRRKGRLWN
jgi:hypothetical protein